MDDAYASCEWIEGGLAFNRRSLHTCLVVHHHTGLPFVADYNGGELPLATLFAAREQIRAANRHGDGHPACRGCPHLKTKRWPRPRYPIEIVGIAQYAYCNIKCSYCFLQTHDPASFAAGLKPYPVLPVIRQLIRDGLLAPDAIIDWGGGEPSVYPEFDELLELLLDHGTFHYIHSNGTRFPSAMRRTPHPQRVHVICSVDAGLPATYVRIKQKDYLERVWANLRQYTHVGAAVSLKYIVKEENCGDADIDAFVVRAAGLGPREVIVDLDYDFPVPSPEVAAGMSRLKALCMAAGVPARFGFTGANFAPEHRVEEQAEAGFGNEQARIGRPGGTPPVSRSPRTRGWLGRLARFVARPRRGWPARDGVAWLDHNLPAQWHAGGLHQTTVRVRNEGTRVWPAEHPEGKHVDLVVLVDRAVRHTVPLPHAVAPGQDATITFDLRMPTDDTKEWEVKLALIEQNVGWLQANGAAPLVVRVRRLPALGAGEDAASLTPTEDRPDGAAQARSDQPAGVRRRVWHLPVADGF